MVHGREFQREFAIDFRRIPGGGPLSGSWQLVPTMATPARTGPLANVVVIDLTRQLAGPQASRIL